MNPDLTNALATFVVALLTALTAVVVRWLTTLRQSNRSSLALAVTQDAAFSAVRAMQQYAKTHGYSDEQLKDYAIQRAISIAKNHGVTLDPITWDTLIEQAVNSMKQMQAAVAKPAAEQQQVVIVPPKEE